MYITETRKVYNEMDINNIAKAIQQKAGSTDKYKVSEMAEAIMNIPTGSKQQLNVRFQPLEDKVINFWITIPSGSNDVEIRPVGLTAKVYDNDHDEFIAEYVTDGGGRISASTYHETNSVRLKIDSVGFIEGLDKVFYK